jgi:D-alanyl-D-alanine carboxypeptidase
MVVAKCPFGPLRPVGRLAGPATPGRAFQREAEQLMVQGNSIAPIPRARGLWPVLMAVLVAAFVIPPAATAQAQDENPDTAIKPPDVTAKALYSYDATSDVVLYAENADERLPIASTVKIMTALIVTKHVQLDEQVQVIAQDQVPDPNVYSNMGLQAGDTLTVKQLLEGLLIVSGSDAANALARYVGAKIGGDGDPTAAGNAFIREMNQTALDMGLTNTRFANPNGDDEDNSYSSAHDLAIMAGQLMQNPDIVSIMEEPTLQVTSVGPEHRTYFAGANTNQLLGQYGVIGGKTGSTPNAGACLVTGRQVNGGTNLVITVVLGSHLEYDADSRIVEGQDKRWSDMSAILDAMDKEYRWVSAKEDGVMPGLSDQMTVWNVGLKDPPMIPAPYDSKHAIRYQLVLVPADGKKQAGEVLIYFGKDRVGALPVYNA